MQFLDRRRCIRVRSRETSTCKTRLTDCSPGCLTGLSSSQLGTGLDDNVVVGVRDLLAGFPVQHPVVPERVVDVDADLVLDVWQVMPLLDE